MKKNNNKVVAKIIKIKKKGDSKKNKDTFQDLYGDIILSPPVDYEALASYHTMSNILPQCVDAMKQNCEGFGFSLIPIIKEEEYKQYEKEIEKEKNIVETFFKYISFEMSFMKLRKETRKDLEIFGNAYYEVIRNNVGKVSGFEYIKSYNVRLSKLTDKTETFFYKRKENSYDYEEVKIKRQFRRFVQIIGSKKIWFKEFGDNRKMSYKTGEFNESVSESEEANELIWFDLGSIDSAYGMPRWIGNYKSIIGSSAVEDVNYKYFDNKAIPPMAILVNNGVLEDDSVKSIEEYINSNIKGKDNYYNVLILEAVGSGNPNSLEQNKVQIDIKELSQIKDAGFLAYDKDNRDKVRSSFRLPPIYVGYSEDYNRATAKESREIAEEQVFKPERSDYDFFINYKILPELGIRYLRFESNAAPEDKGKELVDMYKVMSDIGLTYKEARRLIDKISGIQLEVIEDEEWVNMPIKLSPWLVQLKLREQLEHVSQQKSFNPKDVVNTLMELRKEVLKNNEFRSKV